MILTIIVICIIVIIIVLLFHLKKYHYHPLTKNLKIHQNENYNYKKINNFQNHKQLVIVRNYKKLNNLINIENLQEYNSLINFIKSDYTISNVIKGNYDSFIMLPINFVRPLPILNNLGSLLSISNSIFITYGKPNTLSSILSLQYNRNYLHVIKGEIIIYLIKPYLQSKLYLTSTSDKSIKISKINIQNPELLLYPEYNEVDKQLIPIKLRKGNLLFLPNDWSFYIFHKTESIVLHYQYHTIISKLF